MIGRMLALLDVQSSQFATLPPHFTSSFLHSTEYDELEARTLGPLAYPKLKRVVPFLLASLVFHYSYLEEAVNPNHPFWESAFGRIPKKAIAHYQKFVTLENDPIAPMEVKGVPNSVRVQQKLDTILKTVTEELHFLRDSAKKQEEVLNKVAELLPVSAVGICLESGRRELEKVFDRLHTSMKEHVSDCFSELRPAITSTAQMVPVNSSGSTSPLSISPEGYNVYNWGGKLRLIPFDFILPRHKAVACWNAWWLGPAQNDMPLRSVLRSSHRSDIRDLLVHEKNSLKLASLRVYLHEIGTVMSYFESAATRVENLCDIMPTEISVEHRSGEELLKKLIECLDQNNTSQIRALQNIAWTAAWNVANKELYQHETTDHGPTVKRRKHDLTRASIKAIFRRIKSSGAVFKVSTENAAVDYAC